MPTKNTLRFLVALQIAALLGAVVAGNVSIRYLVVEYALPSYVFSTTPEIFWLGNILAVGLLAAAVGLCFFVDLFRTLYVALTVVLLLLHSLHPSVTSGSMDLLQQADAVLRGAVMALVYFSPLSDLYKPRDRGDIRATQRLFRWIILAQIPLLLAGFGGGILSHLNNPGLGQISDAMDHSHPGADVLAGITLLAYLVVNVCLYKFWRGSHTAYLVVTAAAVLEAFYLSPSVTSAGVEIFTTGITVLNGVILGLAYFSPLRALFDRGAGTPAPSAPPVMSPPAIAPGPVGPVGPRAAAAPVTSHDAPTPVEAAPAAAVSRPVADVAVVPTAAVRFEPPGVIPPPAPAPPPAVVAPPAADAPAVAPPALVDPPAFCAACGARAQGGKFCIQCGAPLPKKLLCPRCGTESQPGKKFCRECGNPLAG